MSKKKITLLLLTALGTLTFLGCGGTTASTTSTASSTDTTTTTATATKSTYSIVDTGQTKSYNATAEIPAPSAGQAF